MRAILIDSKTKTISEVEVGEHYTEIKKALGISSPIDVLAWDEQHDLFIDDEGLLHIEENVPNDFFVVDQELEAHPIHLYVAGAKGSSTHYTGSGRKFAGNGLILANNKEGESVSARLSLESVSKRVSFMSYVLKGWTEGRMKDNPDGSWVYYGPQPILEKGVKS